MGLWQRLWGRGDTKRAMLIDGNPSMCELLRSHLEQDHVTLDPVGTLAEARKRLGDYADAPDLFLVSLRLPDGSGAALMQELASNRQMAHTPKIFLTDRSNENEQQLLLRTFPSARVMVKPLNATDLRRTVKELLDAAKRKLPVAKASLRGHLPPPSRLRVREE